MNGIVQGVGFRPFVYNLAIKLGVTGWVRNTSSGVEIVASGSPADLEIFINSIREHPPTLARVDKIQVTHNNPEYFPNFEIRESQANTGDFIPISPDMSICPDCQRELFDPADRRYRYPFINCTNCGPRFSIIRDIPYDRPLTTMSGFPMCPDCEKEYNNPSDRRYHAQPIACATCGPRVSFKQSGMTEIFADEAITAARALIREGKILAIKGLGGFHLACDASNIDAVSRLHERKLRSDKPFALMCFDPATARQFVQITESEALLLQSPQHPILLLEKHRDITLLDHAAPFQNHLGFMLPYTPLHLLLLEPEAGYPATLVMTSGNISEEPIAYQDDEALTRLETIADGFLLHNRPIHMRVDDSVTRVLENQPYIIRRSRGYAPEPLMMKNNLPEILSCGALLKNTFSMSRGQYIFSSHHIGDLENLETLTSYEQAIEHYRTLFRLLPQIIAVDLHPDYLSTRYGEQLSRSSSLPLVRIQHHHAHLASCLADNDYHLGEPVIGLIFDGTGYGTDGVIWGGEILVGGYQGYERLYHLAETPLPGGDFAIRNPSRIALAYLNTAGIEWTSDLPPVNQYQQHDLKTLLNQLSQHINCPMTTSMGRLFDAVSSLVGVRQSITYEGQAAIELENICDRSEGNAYSLPVINDKIETSHIFQDIVLDMRNGVLISTISARFHNAIANLCRDLCLQIRKTTGISRVALSGGVWQNITLLRKTVGLLRTESFEILTHRRVPTNDGGISIGQTLIAAAVMDKK